MSKNIAQVYADNPIVTNQSDDLMYFGRSPYGIGDDAAMQFSDFSAQFGAAYTPSALTKADDTNVTLTLGGTPSTALLQATSITAGWTGQLSPARGGTGVNNGASTITLGGNLTTSGAFNSTFTMTGATNVTFPTSGTLATTTTASGVVNAGTINQLAWYAATGNAVSGLSTANNGLLVTDSSGVPSIGNTIGAGINVTGNVVALSGNAFISQSLTPSLGRVSLICEDNSGDYFNILTNAATSAARTWTLPDATGTLALTSQIPAITPAALTKTDDTNVTLTLGGTPATALLQATSITAGWTGQLAVSRGGTGISSFGTGVATALGQNVTGSGGIVLATSPTMVTPTLGAASATSLSFSSTSGVIGTATNDSAAAGSVGEIISSVIAAASATSLTTSTPKNVTSIALTAGDWDVWGNVGFSGNAATTFTAGVGWINSASASVPDGSLYAQVIYSPAITVFTIGNVNFTVPGYRVSLSGSATYYLSVSAIFGVNSCSAYGGIYARRRR